MGQSNHAAEAIVALESSNKNLRGTAGADAEGYRAGMDSAIVTALGGIGYGLLAVHDQLETIDATLRRQLRS